ncbi:MAG: peptidylprolyl isomerase [Ginsengibacter sp.]|jgi:peptidyl-prolyl cis-trans isomerase SurA
MKKSLLTFCFLASAFVVFAQPKKVLADKIIATIGDKIILKSDIDNSIHDMERQNIAIPEDARCYLLNQALEIKGLVVQAERDSVPFSKEQVDADIDLSIRKYTMQFGSKEILEQVAGKSIFQLKEDMRPAYKDRQLADNERQRVVKDIRITPKEVQDYYDKIPKDSLHFYESELEVGQIVIYPKPSRDLENYAIEQLKEYKKEVEDGKRKFEVLASLYTDDPGSKQNGGLYEINRNEKQWDPIFLSKAFSLKDGQISNPFKGTFGYHIIQMVSRRGDDATIRHILKIPQVSSIEVNEANVKLDSVRTLLVDNKISFGEAVQKYNEDENSKFTGGLIATFDGTGRTSLHIDEYDADLVKMLKDLTIGVYSKPVEFTDARGNKGVRIIKIISKSEPHRENLKDDYDKVADRALDEKKGAALEKWFVSKLPTMYVKLDPEYKGCEELKKWTVEDQAATAQQ